MLALPQRLLGPLAIGDVAVGLQHAPDPVGVADELVTRRDDDFATVLRPVAKFAFPAPACTQFRLDFRPRNRMDGSQQFMRHAAERLGLRKAVKLLRAAAPALDPAVQPPHHDGVIGQAQQLRQPAQRLLGPLALGDVAVVGDDPGDARVVQEVLADGLNVPPRAVGVPQAELGRDRGPGPAQDRVEEGPLAAQVVGVDDRVAKDVPADPVLRPVPQQTFHRRGLIEDRALGVEEADDVRGVLDQEAEPLLALAQRLLGPLALGDIFKNVDRPRASSLVVVQRFDVHAHDDACAVRLLDDDFRVSRRPAIANAGRYGRSIVRQRRPVHLPQPYRSAESLIIHAEPRLAAPQLGGAPVVEGDPAFGITGVNSGGHERDQLPHSLLALAQRLLGPLALGDVFREPGNARDVPILVLDGEGAAPDPPHRAVRPHDRNSKIREHAAPALLHVLDRLVPGRPDGCSRSRSAVGRRGSGTFAPRPLRSRG